METKAQMKRGKPSLGSHWGCYFRENSIQPKPVLWLFRHRISKPVCFQN